jgi:Cu+-exporting ATPase
VIETIRFPIEGMTCSSCVNRITRALRRIEGVEQVKVDLRGETGTVGRDPRIASDQALAVAIAAAGYEANLEASIVIPTVADQPGFLGRVLARIRA